MVVDNFQKAKRIVSLMIEGSLYGFLCGIFLWVFLYLIYGLERYYKSSGNGKIEDIHIDAAPYFYYIDLTNISLRLMFSSLFARLLVFLVNKNVENTLSDWIKTGMVTFIFLYFSVLIKELYFSVPAYADWLCCLSDSVNLVLWILILILLIIFTFLYVTLRKYLIKFKKL